MSKNYASFYRTSSPLSAARRLWMRAAIACSSLLASLVHAADCGRGAACAPADVLEPGTGWLVLLAVVVVYVARSPSAARWANQPIDFKRLLQRLHLRSQHLKTEQAHEHLTVH